MDAPRIDPGVGTFSAREAWSTLVDLSDGTRLYRLANKSTQDIMVLLDEPRRQIVILPGNTLDVMSRSIKVRTATGTASGTYTLVAG